MPSSRVSSKKTTLILSINLLARIEAAAKTSYCTRSDYIRSAIVQRLNQEHIIAMPPLAQQSAPIKKSERSEEEFLEELGERYA